MYIDLARMMHRHGDQWLEMVPKSDHSPDSRDHERRLLRGEQVYKCEGCDEEVRMIPPDTARADRSGPVRNRDLRGPCGIRTHDTRIKSPLLCP